MDLTAIAWAAGIIDGEGCIFINRTKAGSAARCVNSTYRLGIKVTMGHLPTIQRLHAIFKTGTIQNHAAQNDRVNASFSWICQNRQAGMILPKIRPFLLTKAEEADVAQQFIDLRIAARGGAGGSDVVDTELLDLREKLYRDLRKLKSRWRFYEVKLREMGVSFPE